MIGQTISHYQILEKLGEGGMGVVYKAEDTKLHRPVALKVLPSQALITEEDKTRFAREAQAAASLSHPNVAMIHEFDEVEDPVTGGRLAFIAMEYVEGKTLKDKIQERPLPLNDVVNIASAAAEGLQEAHEKGIVHRDIKSANIMVTSKGQVKIMDFGLAEIAGRSRVTKEGMTVGTTAYMSPEQAMGEKLDQRTDIWSLGVVMYEIITGRLPFQGDYEQAIVYRILNEEPEPITSLRSNVPMELERVVKKAMRNERAERYQHVDELLVDLRALKKESETPVKVQQERSPAITVERKAAKPPLFVGGGIAAIALIVLAYFFLLPKSAPVTEKSIAVLPFVDMSPQKDQDWFCDGITEEIIGRLSNISQLKVAARTSVFFFKGKDQDIREIGQKLGVATVLEGSIQKVETRLRARVQLINIADGFHLWSEEYDRELKDVFAVQDEIALAVADKLKLMLLGDEKARLAKHRAIDPIAYEAYLKGLYYFWQWSDEGTYSNALRHLRRAIEIEPDYAQAHAGIALAYVFASTWNNIGLWSPREGVLKGKEAAERAIDLDPMLADGYVAMGYARMNFDWDWPGAEKDFKRALELSPHSPLALDAYANFLLLARGRLGEAIAVLNRALALDPLSPALHSDLGVFYLLSGQFDRAIPCFRKTLELDSSFFWARLNLGWSHLFTGNTNEALAEFRNMVKLAPLSPYSQQALGYAYGVTGHRDEALEVLANLDQLAKTRYVPPSAKAYVYLGLGQKEVALDCLDKAYAERDTEMIFLKVDPPFTPLRNEPRFQALLKKVGLDK